MHDGKQGWTAKPVPIEADTLPEMRRALIDILRDLERHGVRDARTGEVVQAGSVDQRIGSVTSRENHVILGSVALIRQPATFHQQKSTSISFCAGR
jgi:CO dehydrogenase/acetyl-CoA synthase alpha subunit